MIPNLVPKSLLSGAISMNTVLFTIATIVGPTIGGLVAIFGIDVAYAVSVALLIWP